MRVGNMDGGAAGRRGGGDRCHACGFGGTWAGTVTGGPAAQKRRQMLPSLPSPPTILRTTLHVACPVPFAAARPGPRVVQSAPTSISVPATASRLAPTVAATLAFSGGGIGPACGGSR